MEAFQVMLWLVFSVVAYGLGGWVYQQLYVPVALEVLVPEFADLAPLRVERAKRDLTEVIRPCAERRVFESFLYGLQWPETVFQLRRVRATIREGGKFRPQKEDTGHYHLTPETARELMGYSFGFLDPAPNHAFSRVKASSCTVCHEVYRRNFTLKTFCAMVREQDEAHYAPCVS